MDRGLQRCAINAECPVCLGYQYMAEQPSACSTTPAMAVEAAGLSSVWDMAEPFAGTTTLAMAMKAAGMFASGFAVSGPFSAFSLPRVRHESKVGTLPLRPCCIGVPGPLLPVLSGQEPFCVASFTLPGVFSIPVATSFKNCIFCVFWGFWVKTDGLAHTFTPSLDTKITPNTPNKNQYTEIHSKSKLHQKSTKSTGARMVEFLIATRYGNPKN